MNYFTIKVKKNQIRNLLKEFKSYLIQDKNEYVLFRAKKDNVDYIAYTTGSFCLKGENIENAISDVKKTLGIKNYTAIGSDEVGCGDLFGPVCVCACVVRENDYQLIEKLNVRDSKKISDEEINKMAPILAKNLIHTLIILSPENYNKLIEKNNLNKIKALLHNQVYLKTITKYPNPVPVILDAFCSEKNYFSYLKNEKYVHRTVLFYEKAEDIHPSVAAAAIIARYAFLNELKKYESKLGVKIPKGAGEKANKTFKLLTDKFDREKIIKYLCKSNFKNIKCN